MIPIFQKGFDRKIALKTRKKYIRKLLNSVGIVLNDEAIDYSIALLATMYTQTISTMEQQHD